MPIILDHSIVGQSLTSLTIRKDREFAACRICGDVFQSAFCIHTLDEEWDAEIELAAHIETRQWRSAHNRKHPQWLHEQFRSRGITFTPEAAIKLAPFGLVPIADTDDIEIAQALAEAPRAPHNDVETTLKGWR